TLATWLTWSCTGSLVGYEIYGKETEGERCRRVIYLITSLTLPDLLVIKLSGGLKKKSDSLTERTREGGGRLPLSRKDSSCGFTPLTMKESGFTEPDH